MESKNPSIAHVTLFPSPNEFSVQDGIKNGPLKRAKDWIISDTLIPKIIRRYGVDSRSPFFLRTIIKTITREARKETVATDTAPTIADVLGLGGKLMDMLPTSKYHDDALF
eukprot:195757_1